MQAFRRYYSALYLAKDNSLGGIFEFRGPSTGGSSPPPEIAALLGIRTKKEKEKRRTTATKTTTSKSSNGPRNTEKSGTVAPMNDAEKRRMRRLSGEKNEVGEKLDDLEKHVLSKYGSNAFKDSLKGDDDDWDEEESPKKNQPKRFVGGFDPVPKPQDTAKGSAGEGRRGQKKQPAVASSNADDLEFVFGFEGNNDDSTAGLKVDKLGDLQPKPARGLLSRRLSRDDKATADEYSVDDIFSGSSSSGSGSRSSRSSSGGSSSSSATKSTIGQYTEEEEYEYEGMEIEGGADDDDETVPEQPRSGPLNAVGGFRLRRPAPITTEAQAKIDAKAAALLAKDEEQKEKRKAKKELEKNMYLPFEFRVAEDVDDFDQIFTTKSFSDIGVEDPIVLRNLERMNIFNPTKIQEQAIPQMMAGKDVLLHAQTGSGKTLAFLLPLLNTVDRTKRKVQAIVMAPSRELVTQIGAVGDELFKGTGINVLSLIGGANVRNQIKRLREQKPQIIIATPGRLAELVFQLRKLRLGMVRAVIVDEVDSMLREPFVGELQTIFEATPLFSRRSPELGDGIRQPAFPSRMLTTSSDSDVESILDEDEGEEESFDDDEDVDEEPDTDTEGEDDDDSTLNKRLVCLASATSTDPNVKLFAERYCSPNWARVAVPSASMLPSGITHGLISTPRMRALEMLKRFLKAKPAVVSALIFVNDPHRVEIIYEQLLEMGFIAAPLHGESSKDDRKEILSRLRDGRLNLVVTTELAARGLDIPDLTHVINFELPTDAQHYVHRAGRCGRAGRKGLVMNFANPDTKFVIRRFGKQLGVKVQDCEIREGQVHLKLK